MGGIFISYRQDDAKAWALLLGDDLVAAFGTNRVFLDKDSLQPGKWRSQLDEALQQCRAVVLVIGRAWLTAADEVGQRRLWRADDVHRREIAVALARPGVTVIPVLVDNASVPRPGDLPEDIRSLIELQFRGLSDSRARRAVDLRVLLEDLERATGLKARRPAGAAAVGRVLLAVLRFVTIAFLASLAIVVAAEAFFGVDLTRADQLILFLTVSAAAIVASRLWRRRRNPSA